MATASVTLRTSLGDLRLRLYARDAPRTCRNFLELCKAGYYDGIIFHRVVPDFMCQSGDPRGDGTGGASIYGEKFDDEIVGRLSHDRPGILSMANSGRNTNSSQFFITFRKCPHLDGKHTVFGCVEGDDSLRTLADFAAVPLKNKKPVKPLKIFTVIVHEDPWADQPLPPGAAIPEKELLDDEGGDGSKCVVS